jgi:hypothetical protein
LTVQVEYHPQTFEKASNQADFVSWFSWNSTNPTNSAITTQPDSTPFQALMDGIRLAYISRILAATYVSAERWDNEVMSLSQTLQGVPAEKGEKVKPREAEGLRQTLQSGSDFALVTVALHVAGNLRAQHVGFL